MPSAVVSFNPGQLVTVGAQEMTVLTWVATMVRVVCITLLEGATVGGSTPAAVDEGPVMLLVMVVLVLLSVSFVGYLRPVGDALLVPEG